MGALGVWLSHNFKLLLPATVTIVLLAVDGVRSLMKKETTTPVKIYFVLILAMLLEITWGLSSTNQPKVEELRDSMRFQYGENPYLDDKIDVTLKDLASQLGSKHFQARPLNGTLEELLRAVERTVPGDTIDAIDYGIPWSKEFREYQLQNIRAAKRGVAITRVFIIPDETIRNPIAAEDLWNSMKEQINNGIKVKFGTRSRIRDHREYRPEGFVIFNFKRGSPVIMVEVHPYYLILLHPDEPYLLNITWSMEDVSGYQNFFDWLIAVAPQQGLIQDISVNAARPF